MCVYLLLLLQAHLLAVVLQGCGHGRLQGLLVLLLLLLQGRLDVDLLPHPLLSQLAVQLVDAPVGVGDQGVEVILAQLPCWVNTRATPSVWRADHIVHLFFFFFPPIS